MATHDFSLHVYHIPGKENANADLLPRWHITTYREEKLYKLVNAPVWSLVADSMVCINYDI